ncbi:MAG: DUF1987 domain-containing protein [Cyclobacteriaceae bacterium]
MMTYHKEATRTTPGIDLDMDSGFVKLFGRSSPENSVQFYAPLLDALRTPNPNLTRLEMDFRLEYFNTSSSKCLYDIFKLLKRIETEGIELSINWYYEPMDEDMFEAGEDFSELLDLEFNFIEQEDVADYN